jgi:hypothetical protein
MELLKEAFENQYKNLFMKKTHKYLSFLSIAIGTIFSFSSCYVGSGVPYDPYLVSETRQKENFYYIPSAQNTPLHSQKNDLNFSLMGTSDSKYSGGDVQASYMPGKQVGIMASYSFARSNYGYSGNSGNTKYNRFELGSGFVTELSKNWHFETYAGFGNGKILNTHHTGNSKISLTHFFLQPTIAVSNENKKIQLGFVSKFSGVNFNVADTLYSTGREPFTTSQIESLYAKPFHIIWEPGFVFRAGWKNFQFHTGYSLSTDLTNPDLYKANNNFSMGISFRINTVDKK